MKYVFVVNRSAGRGSVAKKWTALEARVAEMFDEYEVVFDLAPGAWLGYAALRPRGGLAGACYGFAGPALC